MKTMCFGSGALAGALVGALAVALVGMAGLAGCATEPGVKARGAGPGYVLVWNDEFDVDGPVDERKWMYEEGFVRNFEAQYYQRANVTCRDGVLVIEARRERAANSQYDPAGKGWFREREFAEYTSGSIKTRDLHEWTFGRFEMRGRIDIRPGLWPAFWLRGDARQWPACGEIDVMEYFQRILLANVMWGSPKAGVALQDNAKVPIEEVATKAGYASAEAWARDFHVWRMDWDKDWIRLYVDDRLMNEIDVSKTINQTPDGANPMHEPHHIIMNLSVGGTAGGDPSATEFPARFEVDWVRVYQKAGGE